MYRKSAQKSRLIKRVDQRSRLIKRVDQKSGPKEQTSPWAQNMYKNMYKICEIFWAIKIYIFLVSRRLKWAQKLSGSRLKKKRAHGRSATLVSQTNFIWAQKNLQTGGQHQMWKNDLFYNTVCYQSQHWKVKRKWKSEKKHDCDHTARGRNE